MIARRPLTALLVLTLGACTSRVPGAVRGEVLVGLVARAAAR